MQVLIDGRSVYLPPFSTVLWDDLPIAIDDIERIEVTRGPNAASYGANAFFGTVNILTRAPVAGEGTYALARGGTDDVRDLVVRQVGGNAGSAFRLTAGRKGHGGFQGIYDSQHHVYSTGRYDLDVDPRDAVSAQAGLGAGRRQLGNPTASVDRPREKHVHDGYLQFGWHRTQDAADEATLNVSIQRHAETEAELTEPVALGGGPPQVYALQADYAVRRLEIEAQWTHRAGALRVVGGVGMQRDVAFAPVYFGGRGSTSSGLQRLFAHAEWQPSAAWLLQAGGMLEHTSQSGSDTAPRVSATLRLDDRRSLRFSVSRATRTPSMFESQGEFDLRFGPNSYPIQGTGGNVQPEHLTSSELGFYAASESGAALVDAKVFRDRATNLIDEFADPAVPYVIGPPTYLKNLDAAIVSGFEAGLRLRPAPSAQFVASYAYIVVSSRAFGLLRTAPRNLLSMMASGHFGGGWSGAVALYANSGLPYQPGSFGQSEEPAVGYGRRIDTHVGREIRAGSLPARFTVGWQALGSGYVEFRPDTKFTRRAYLQFSAGL